MARPFSRRLVIDADIAQAASEREFPRSTACRTFLSEVLGICHRVVMTASILGEWKQHAGRFAMLWLVAMRQRNKVVEVSVPEDNEFRERIAALTLDASRSEAMLKDIHLVQAALAADGRVVSMDEAARKLFVAASREVSELKKICWVNPERDDEKPLAWLKTGARNDKKRQLGSAKE